MYQKQVMQKYDEDLLPNVKVITQEQFDKILKFQTFHS